MIDYRKFRFSKLNTPQFAHLKLLLFWPVYGMAFFFVERISTDRVWRVMHCALDDLIPFCEYFVIFYCLWYVLLIGVGLYLLFRDRDAFRRYMQFLAITFFLSELIWILVPNGQDLRPAVMPRDNLFTALISALYRIDTNTNVFPSVHVVGAVGAALAVWDSHSLRHRKMLRWGVVVLAALICVSTLFVKQHAILDVVSGLMLSLLAALPVYRRSPAFARR